MNTSLLPVFITEQNLVEMLAVMLVVFCRYMTRHRAIMDENVTASTNRKYITYRNAVREGPRQKNLMKFGHVVFKLGLCEWTDKQTTHHNYISCTLVHAAK